MRCLVTSWNYDSFNIIKRKQIADLMDSKRFRKNDIFKSLKNDMNKNGIMWDAKQIQIKYKSFDHIIRKFWPYNMHKLISE